MFVDVTRYDLLQEGNYSMTEGVMHEAGNGDWVKYEYYETLKGRVFELEDIIKAAKEYVNDAHDKLRSA